MLSLVPILLTFAIVAVLIKPLGIYMARVYSGEGAFILRPLGVIERLIYRLCGIDPAHEMKWLEYAGSVLMLGAFSFLLLFCIAMAQGALPFNPQHVEGVSPDLAFNIAISFITNTNWQSYSGEVQLSYFTQTLGIAVQQFLSAATGMAVAAALFRGLSRKQMPTIGNAWADITRGMLYILLPLSLLFALFLVTQGVVQTFMPYITYTPLQSVTGDAPQMMALGPIASQAAIELLGSNGGGFFNANSAHPFQNPTPLTNIFQIVAILLIPAALLYSFGTMVGDRRQGWMMIIAMTVMFTPLMMACVLYEQEGNPRFDEAVINQDDGNLEGKELRFSTESSSLWAAAATATSNGSVNSMHDSYLPLGGLIPLLLMQFGEVIFGGVGSGAYGILIFTLLTVFIGGLMVGRTPEYLGKKLGPYEIKMASLVIIIPSIIILVGTAIAVLTEAGRAGPLNVGAQAFSEILYAFTSAGNNNGSAFAGLSAGTPFYNIILGICMFIGRYWIMVPVLAIAGSLAAKNTVPPSAGTLSTHTALFAGMLIGIITLIGILTFVPALALGPIAEHMHLYHAGAAQ